MLARLASTMQRIVANRATVAVLSAIGGDADPPRFVPHSSASHRLSDAHCYASLWAMFF
jgi:hypothetical protein